MKTSILKTALVIMTLVVISLILGSVNTPEAIAESKILETSIDDQTGVSITVYNSGSSLVRDVRNIKFPGGMVDLKFMDVASEIDPTSVHFASLTNPDGISIWEQNYEYDLISQSKLMEKYIGMEISFRQFNAETEKYDIESGILLSTQGGYVIQMEDKIHLGYPGEVILPELPDGLITRPTLVWLLDTASGGNHEVEMSYLTSGLSWRANYVAVINEKDDALDLNGWVTLNNTSGATYNDAKLKLIAGDVNRVQPEREMLRSLGYADSAVMEAKAAPSFKEKSFFEYHMYTLQRPATLKNNQQKQISLLEGNDVTAEKLFIYEPSGDYWYGGDSQKGKIQVKMAFMNEKKNGLGIPLPKGTVRVFKADTDGSLQLIGEDNIDHTPKDEELRLFLGEAFDIVGERILKNRRKISNRIWEYDVEIILRNHKDEGVVVTVVDHARGDWSILTATSDWNKKDASTFEFPVKVKKDGEVKITYTVRREY